MSRPHRNKVIGDLEALFSEACANGDSQTVRDIIAELDQRPTPAKLRNQRLAHRAAEFLAKGTRPAESKAPKSADATGIDVDAEPTAPRVDIGPELPPPAPPRAEGRRRPISGSDHLSKAPPAPISEDEALRLLQAWTALEVLSPASVYRRASDLVEGVEARVAELEPAHQPPWERGETSRRGRRLFYQLVLGSLRMAETTSALLEAFTDYNQDRGPVTGFAPMCIVTLSSKGMPIGVEGITVSSFAWGVPRALSRDLRSLGEWTRHEVRLCELVASWVTRVDEETDELLPLDLNTIHRAYANLVAELKLTPELVVEPQFALRVYQYFRAEEPPEPPPMGSYFLNDLAWADASLRNGDAPELLRRYLGLAPADERIDLRKNIKALDALLSPDRIPRGAWPAVGGHPLTLMQQAAVHASSEADIFAVNGPPGTGKTTLLRDVIAARVVQRADRLVEFEDPKTAFSPGSHTQRINEQPCRHYSIHESLRGFEIVVASSNNKAVENVSEALPRLNAVSFISGNKRYFAPVSDNVARGLGGENDTEISRRPDPPSVTWGLAAAVLGNSRNRFAFSQCAWKDFDFGLRSYFLELSGAPQRLEVKDPNTGRIIEKRTPRIVELELSGRTEHSNHRWKAARSEFIAVRRKVEQRLDALAKGRTALEQQEALVVSGRIALERSREKEGVWSGANVGFSGAEQLVTNTTAELRAAQIDLAAEEAAKPRGWPVFFNRGKLREWRERIEAGQARLSSAETRQSRAIEAHAQQQERIAHAKAALEQAKRTQVDLDQRLAAIDADISAAFLIAGERYVDAAFFERGHQDLQRDTAWLDRETQRLRSLLFEHAISLHRAFVDVAAGPVRNNLDLLFRTFFGKGAWAPALRSSMADLWATFFLVVPAISTTYASIERMLGYLPPGGIGLLLLDESGQAAPQSAVGAIMRSRQAVIVGDPLQLPPVVSLPTALCDTIAQQCGVDSERFVAASRAIPLVASVQTLADAASSYGTHLDTLGAWIGLPLLVHRRCAEPMFSLSNLISYEGSMVQGRGLRPSAIREALGASRWIDVQAGHCVDKWNEAEGSALVEELRRLASALGDSSPDLYVISPFRIVVQRLRDLLLRQPFLRTWTDSPSRWVSERVGTVYTVQGREADSVFIVLGAAEPVQRGARAWAGNPANQLNVAITRAKENIYVIGNRFEWASAGYVADLELALPRE